MGRIRGSPLSRRLSEHPESFPVNTLVPIEGTPLEKNDVGGLFRE